MTEEENRAWVVYTRLLSYTENSTPSNSWYDLSGEEQKFYLNLSKHLDLAARRLADDIDKRAFTKLINQEHWT